MAEIELDDDTLVLHVKGIDRFLAFTSRFEVPRDHVAEAVVGVAEDAQKQLQRSLRIPGAFVPGVIVAGHYVRVGRGPGPWTFWDVHRGHNAITIYLADHRYNMLVAEVDDPTGAVERVNTWCRGTRPEHAPEDEADESEA